MAYFGQMFLFLSFARFVLPTENVSTFSTTEGCTSTPSYTDKFEPLDNLVQLPNFDNPHCEKDPHEVDMNLSNVGFQRIPEHFIDSSVVTCLRLDNNNITEMSASAFDRLPNLRFLDLSGNEFDERKFLYFSRNENLKTLILDDIFASKVREPLFMKGRFPFPNLESLHLRKNNLSIWNNVLQSLPSTLTNLHLSGNKLGDYFDVSFQSFPKSLTHISLDGNSFSRLIFSSNFQLKDLVYINVNNNKFRMVRRSGSMYLALAIEHLSKLQYLLLSGNRITGVSGDQLSGVTALIYLDLSHNKIGFLGEDSFSRLTQLRVLNVSDNFLTRAPKFLSNPNLKNINLSNNQIQTIENDTFSNLPSLEYLDLSGNGMRYLPENWTLLRMNLRVLVLKNNLFTDFKNFHLTKSTSLVDLHIGGNPITRVNSAMLIDVPMNISVHFQNQECQSDPSFNLQSKQVTGDDYEVVTTTTTS